MTIDDDALVEAAKAVRARAHAPYSGYHVGSAVLDEKGRTHCGCNVENAAYPEGICAETSAIAAMVAAGGSQTTINANFGGNSISSGMDEAQFDSMVLRSIQRLMR